MATTTNKAAKMQTSTNITTTDDKPSKSGTTIDLDGPNITHYAPTNDTYKHLGPTGDNEEEELPIKTAMHHTNQGTAHTKIDTTTHPNNLETPPKAPLSPPSKAFVHRLYNSRTSGLPHSPVTLTNTTTPREPECHTIPVLTPLQRHSKTLLSSFSVELLSLLPNSTLQLVRTFQQPPGCTPSTYLPTGTSPPTTLRHRHYPLLEPEILHLATHLGSLHSSSSTIDITCVSNNVRSLHTGVSEVLHNSDDDDLLLIEETLLLVLHVLRRANSYRRALTTCMLDPLSKDERNRTDGSGDMPVQSYWSVPSALVDCSDPADSCAKTMTWRDVGDSLATQNFDADSVVIAPKTPYSSKISQVSTPLSRDYYPQYSPCSFEKSPQARTHLQIR
jgi:hypothetical protein